MCTLSIKCSSCQSALIPESRFCVECAEPAGPGVPTVASPDRTSGASENSYLPGPAATRWDGPPQHSAEGWIVTSQPASAGGPAPSNRTPAIAIGLVLLLALGGLLWVLLVHRPADQSTSDSGFAASPSGAGQSVDDGPTGPAGSNDSEADPAPEYAEPDPSQPVGDLGLTTAISKPACDGQYVTFVGSVVTPGSYSDGIQRVLDRHPGSSYLLSENTCSSLRPRMPDGSSIYSVYLGPFGTQEEACAAALEAGGGSYVKRLDDVTPSSQIPTC